MPPLSIDEYIAAISPCSSTEQLFSMYRTEIEREGFQNITFIRVKGAEILEVPYLNVREDALEAYLEQNLAEHDPIFRMIRNRAPAFTYHEMAQHDLTHAERLTLGACSEIGCSGGYTMPFYGPYGFSDIIDISFREPRGIDPARFKIVSMKSYATWMRYQELDSVALTRDVLADDDAACGPKQHAMNETPVHHRDGHERISAEECRALVICEIAVRRYKAGLTELNNQLEETLGTPMFARLRSRGLLSDVPDDDHWRFYYRPSPVAVAHLRRCQHVAGVRDQAWRLHVRTEERPAEQS